MTLVCLLVPLLICLVMGTSKIIASSSITEGGVIIVKSHVDKANYRFIELENGLQALLIHEEGIDKASAAMDVSVGSMHDPTDIPGLAHFLEHLLFMGTAKYPRENEYSQFLAEHAGYSNAFTAGEHTCYYFEVAQPHLEGALDRFAQFFVEPLFDPNSTDREMQAVDSENKKNLNNDNWRLHQLEKSLSDPTHPYSKFGTGNLDTLGTIPRSQGIDIRKVLIDFYERHYSANLMRLVVYGAESLDTLQSWVESRFAGVSNRGHQVTKWDPRPWIPGKDTRQLVIAKTIRQVRSLYLCWLLPDQRASFLTKPAQYYSHLLGHEGEGSLLSLLKSQGWATRLSAGVDEESNGFSFFQIVIELSSEGLNRYPEIAELVFSYLHHLQMVGPQSEVYEECHELEQLHFRFRDKSPPSTLTHRLARNMQLYPPAYLIAGPHLMQHYDEALIGNFLGQLLSLDNFRMMLACAEVEPDGAEWQVEPWYGTEYIRQPLDEAFLRRLEVAKAPSALHLPDRNPFIPQDVAIKHASTRINPLRSPRLVLDEPAMRVWHKLDDIFEAPKANVYTFLRSPIINNSPLNFIKSYLVVECWRDAFNEAAYPAELAGLRYDMLLNNDGIDVRVSGFHDKLPVLIQQLFDRLTNFTVDQHRFDLVKDQYARWLKNLEHETPSWHTTYLIHGLLQQRAWFYWDKLPLLAAITKEDIEKHARNFVDHFRMECLVHGNLEGDEAIEIAQMIHDRIAPRFINRYELHPIRAVKLPCPSSSFVYASDPLPNANSAVEVYLQIGSLAMRRERVLAQLFVQVFQESFFDTLRTKEQLGYVVTHQLREKAGSIGLRFLVQSERDPFYLDDRIEWFIGEQVPQIMSNLSDVEFARHQASLVHALLAKKKKLTEESLSYWTQILPKHYEFERAQVDAQMANSLTLADLRDFIQQYVVPTAPLRRRLAIHVWSNQFTPFAHRYTNGEWTRGELIEDPSDFCASMELFPVTYDRHLPSKVGLQI